jgi:hypothetical protein
MNDQANIGMGIGGLSVQEGFVWEDMTNWGRTVAYKTLCYKPEGRGFDPE